MERYVAIDNVCAWPNLTLLPNGEIIATIFNAPHHVGPGNIECWASEDDGRLWKLRAAPDSPPEGENRVNQAAGVAGDDALIVIMSGRDVNRELGDPERVLPRPKVFRSEDNGHTWERIGEVAVPDTANHHVIPFGDVLSLPDGTMAAPFYAGHKSNKDIKPNKDIDRESDARRYQSFLIFSHDRGATWDDCVEIGTWDHDETSVLPMDNGRWIAAARTFTDMHTDLFVSDDEGRTWEYGGPLALTRQAPAHLCRLNDGRVLLSYGIRNTGIYAGIGTRVSEDGETWGTPSVIFNPGKEGAGDGTYPSSVQVADGTMVTAYYSAGIPAHSRYHMGVVRWRIKEITSTSRGDPRHWQSARWRD